MKIEGTRIKKPLYVWASSPGEAQARARKCADHWIRARGWEPGMFTKELLQ